MSWHSHGAPTPNGRWLWPATATRRFPSPTHLPLARWDRPSHLLAGRDLQSGGTWLGVSERGRFAVVTNLRGYGHPDPGRPARLRCLRGAAELQPAAAFAGDPYGTRTRVFAVREPRARGDFWWRSNGSFRPKAATSECVARPERRKKSRRRENRHVMKKQVRAGARAREVLGF